MAHGDIKTRSLGETKSSSSASCVRFIISSAMNAEQYIAFNKKNPRFCRTVVRCSPPLLLLRSRSPSIWRPCSRCCGGTADGSHGCDRPPTLTATSTRVMSKANTSVSTGRRRWHLRHPFWMCPSRPRSIPPRRLHHYREGTAACWPSRP